LFEPFRHNAGAMILSAFNFQFAAGVLAGWAFTRIRLGRACWPLMAGSIVLIVVILSFMQMHDIKKYDALDYISPARTWWVIALALPLAGLTWALAGGSAMVRVPGWARYLGAASYSIYLIHLPAMSLAKPFIVRLIPGHLLTSPIAVVPFAVAGVIAGVVFHALVEKPLLRVLRARFLSPNVSTTRGNFSATGIRASEQPDAQAVIIANEGTASVAVPSTE
jgi:peptidoglycan/LPS O-acetylase OafA/YrhL